MCKYADSAFLDCTLLKKKYTYSYFLTYSGKTSGEDVGLSSVHLTYRNSLSRVISVMSAETSSNDALQNVDHMEDSALLVSLSDLRLSVQRRDPPMPEKCCIR